MNRKTNRLATALAFLATLIASCREATAPAPSPKPGVSSRKSIAVLALRNETGDASLDWLAATLPEIISIDLSSSSKLRVIPRDRVWVAESEPAVTPTESAKSSSLSRIRAATGCDLVLGGSFASTPTGLVIRIRATDARTGSQVASSEASGPVDGLAAVVERAVGEIRSALSPGDTGTDRASLVAMSTDVARVYTNGVDAFRRARPLEARDALERVTTLAPDDPRGWAALSDAWSMMGYTQRARDAARRSWELSAGLPREEKLLVEARYRASSGGFAAAIAIYELLWKTAPDDVEHGLRLAAAQIEGGRGNDALATVKRLRDLTPQDTSDPRIDLTEAAAAESISDFTGEIAAARRAVEAAHSARLATIQARALLRLSWAQRNLGKTEDALAAAHESREISVATGDRLGVARATNAIATIVRQQGDFRRGALMDEESLAVFRELGDRRGEIWAINNLARALLEQGELRMARRRFEESRAVAVEIADQADQARAISNLGYVDWKLGMFEDSERLLRESESIAGRVGSRRIATWARSNLAEVLFETGRPDEAIAMQRATLESFRRIGEPRGVTFTLSSLCSLLVQRGSIAEAKPVCGEAIDHGRKSGDRRLLAFAIEAGADLAVETRLLEDAHELHEEALALRSELGDQWGMASSSLSLGRIALLNGDNEVAAHLSQSAAVWFRGQRADHRAAIADATAAIALERSGAGDLALAALKRATGQADRGASIPARLRIGLAMDIVRSESGAAVATSKSLRHLRSLASEPGVSLYTPLWLQARLEIARMESRLGNIDESRRVAREVRDAARDSGLTLLEHEASSLGKP